MYTMQKKLTMRGTIRENEICVSALLVFKFLRIRIHEGLQTSAARIYEDEWTCLQGFTAPAADVLQTTCKLSGCEYFGCADFF